ncbi:hypothetical protein HDU67_005244, partial [Dinochytrium kinnereticum]
YDLISVAVEPITIAIDDEEQSDDDDDSCLEECWSEDYETDDDDDENKIDLAAASAEGWIRTLFNKRVKLGRIPRPILFNFCDWIRCPRVKPVVYKKYQGPVPKPVDDVRMPVFIRSYADVVAGRGL